MILFRHVLVQFFFFFNDTATTEIYTLSLHDALPIRNRNWCSPGESCTTAFHAGASDRKSTRLNSSHVEISYAVFCLKKKKIKHLLLERNKKTKQEKKTTENKKST